MSLYDLLRPIAFCLDPERVHDAGMRAIQHGWVTGHTYEHPILAQRVFGKVFPNPLGLAAGFDKNAVAVKAWHRFGFGFAEIGTVTAHAQPGSPKPRLFRLPEEQAIINRMGFNNDGASAIAERLIGIGSRIPLGINLGKSKVTPIEKAVDDYVASFGKLAAFADYVVVNVSSPNTPGLRTLQEKGPLLEIVNALRQLQPSLALLIKVAPDLSEDALGDVIEVVAESGAAGIIATNTTIQHTGEQGGLSGLPLRERALGVMKFLSARAPKGTVLVGVGGIFTGDDLYDRIAAGAHLCQVYTGWVYGGPDTAATILEDFVARLEREGVRSLAELRN